MVNINHLLSKMQLTQAQEMMSTQTQTTLETRLGNYVVPSYLFYRFCLLSSLSMISLTLSHPLPPYLSSHYSISRLSLSFHLSIVFHSI